MLGRHAIVIGGSIGGLLAAEVLGGRFDQVTLIERDTLPRGPEARKGVPQSRQTHGLLAGGREALETLFPGISAALVADGAVPCDVLADSLWFMEGGWLARRRQGLDGLLMSRPFLEAEIRRRVLARRNLTVREGCAPDGLVCHDGQVTGVRLGSQTLTADLVVDASGRGSHAPRWLEAVGYSRPAEQRVEVGIRYMTRRFRRRPSAGEASAIIIPPTPQGKRGGVMLAQEHDVWTVTMVSNFGEAAPADLDGFIGWARQLPASRIFEVIREAEPIGDAEAYHFPFSVRRRYETLARVPERFLVVGDAICSFNPIYGQGMSVSAREALELAEALDGGLAGLPRRFFRRAGRVIDVPWNIAVGSDLRMPETVGPRNAGVSFVNWYLARLHQAAHADAVLSHAFMRVANLVAPPAAIFAPPMVLRVARGWWRRRGSRRDAPAAAVVDLGFPPGRRSSVGRAADS